MKKLAVLLIVAGILTMLYPVANRTYISHRQEKILENWEDSCEIVEPPPPVEEERIIQEESAVETESLSAVQGTDPVAVLFIEKIDLEIPVFLGATRANLRLGAGLLDTGVLLGEKGNVVITAHRSHSYGMQFNRLDEIEVGDEVLVKTKMGEYRYVAYATQIVEPARISLIDAQGDASLLTLVTCHPLYSRDPPYRLVVQASMN